MLTLTRNVSQSIMISDDIIITVDEIKAGYVTLTIKQPKGICNYVRSALQSINLSETILVVVLGIYGRQTRLGIRAPIGIPIHREEIYNKIKRKQRERIKE